MVIVIVIEIEVVRMCCAVYYPVIHLNGWGEEIPVTRIVDLGKV